MGEILANPLPTHVMSCSFNCVFASLLAVITNEAMFKRIMFPFSPGPQVESISPQVLSSLHQRLTRLSSILLHTWVCSTAKRRISGQYP